MNLLKKIIIKYKHSYRLTLMKRIIKAIERPTIPKKGLIKKRRFFKRIKQSKKKYFQINAPHNTSQYLIENNSSPFYEDDDDINVDFIPSSLVILNDTEDLLDDASIYQRKFSSASTQLESIKIDSHLGKQTSIFSLN